MTLAGIPISEDQCIGDSLEYLNGAFQTLSANLLSLSATGGSLNIVDSANIDLTYQSSSKVLSAVVSVSGASSGQMMTFNGTQWGGARPFPTWNSTPQTSATNNQIGSGWVNYRAALLDTIRNNDVIVGDRLTTPNGTYSSVGLCTLLKDGRVYIYPYANTRARIYNPVDNSLTTPNGNFPGGTVEFSGGVLLSDGRVYCTPYRNSTTARIYDPIADSLTTPGGTFPTAGGSFVGGILLPDGRAYMAGSASPTARIYDPVADTLTTPPGTADSGVSGNGALAGSVLLPDGRVYCIPHNGSTARIYNPYNNTTITPTGTFPGPGTLYAFYTGVLLPNGKVFCVPDSSTTARIYDPVTDTLTIPNGTYPGASAHLGGVLLPDGRVFCIPNNSSVARIYDPVKDIVTTPSGTYQVGGFGNGVLLPNGKVYILPLGSTTARIYDPTNTYDTVSLDMNFVTSPFNNKY